MSTVPVPGSSNDLTWATTVTGVLRPRASGNVVTLTAVNPNTGAIVAQQETRRTYPFLVVSVGKGYSYTLRSGETVTHPDRVYVHGGTANADRAKRVALQNSGRILRRVRDADGTVRYEDWR